MPSWPLCGARSPGIESLHSFGKTRPPAHAAPARSCWRGPEKNIRGRPSDSPRSAAGFPRRNANTTTDTFQRNSRAAHDPYYVSASFRTRTPMEFPDDGGCRAGSESGRGVGARNGAAECGAGEVRLQGAVSGQRSGVSNRKSAISGQQRAVSGQRSAISDQASAVSDLWAAISRRQSAVGYPGWPAAAPLELWRGVARRNAGRGRVVSVRV